MGARQRDWARRLRRKIIHELGDECAGYKKKCGKTKKLQLDCIVPVGNNHGKWDYTMRISFYRKQQKAGNLQILCTWCHEKKSADENRNNNHPEFQYDDDNTPF